MSWDAGSIESHLDVDTSPFNRGLDEAKRRAREFADERYTATVDLNTKRTDDELAAVERRLHSIESTVDRIGTKAGGGSGGRGGFLSRFAGASIPNPSGRLLALGAALPLAGPFGGLAAGIGGGVLSASATGLLGLGAFGAGAKSSIATVGKDVTTLDKLTKQYNASVTNKQRAAVLAKEKALWDSLDPAQRRAVKNVDHLEASWKRYQKALEPQTFRVLADGSKIADTGLKYLLPTAKAVGDEVDSLAKRAEHAFTAPFWKQFFGDFLPGEAVKSVDTLGRTLGNFLTGGAHLIQGFAPLAHDLDSGLVSLSGRFEKWTEGAGPGKFVAWVEKNGPPAAKALEGLGKGIEGLAIGFAPLGQIELRLLTPVLTAVGDLSKAHPKVIEAVGAALLVVGAGLKAVNLAQGAAGVLSKIPGLKGIGGGGGPGGGGVAGAITGRGSTPLNPLYVFVVDKAPGAGAVKTVEKVGEEGAKLGLGARALSIIKGARPIGAGAAALGIPLAVADMYLEHPHSAPVLPQRDLQAASRDPQVMNAYKSLLAKYETTHANSSATSSYAQAGLLRQAIAQVASQGSAAATGAGATVGDALNRSLDQRIRTRLGPLASQDTRIAVAQIAKEAATAANAGGITIGEQLTDGVAMGIELRKARAKEAAGEMTAATLGKMRQILATGSPSRVTMQYGKWMAEGLAIGFAGYSDTLLKTFGKTTQGALDAIGGRLNNAANQYRSDLAARAQLSSSISSGVLGNANLSSMTLSNTGGNSVGGFLGGNLRTDKRLLADLNLLKRRHLNATALQQIAEAPPAQGIAIAESILHGKQSISSINADERALASVAGKIGSVTSGAVFAGTLSRDARQLEHMATLLTHLLAKKEDLSPQAERAMERAFAKALHAAFPSLSLSALDKALGMQIGHG